MNAVVADATIDNFCQALLRLPAEVALTLLPMLLAPLVEWSTAQLAIPPFVPAFIMFATDVFVMIVLLLEWLGLLCLL